MRLASKLAIDKNSTIFVQSWPNFHQLTSSFMETFGKVSPKLNKNCRFFINRLFAGQSHFLWISLYLEHCSLSTFNFKWFNPIWYLWSIIALAKILEKILFPTLQEMTTIIFGPELWWKHKQNHRKPCAYFLRSAQRVSHWCSQRWAVT